jgi:hypothetical protein
MTTEMPLPKNAKRWSLNDRQFVQNSANRRITYRQIGGRHYRGITLSPSQFREMDKAIESNDLKYFVSNLGHGIFFSHPRDDIFTLWKQSKKNPKVDVAFFRFDQPTWLHYLKEVHSQIKSLLRQDEQE